MENRLFLECCTLVPLSNIARMFFRRRLLCNPIRFEFI
uniref:Uncharacterized protein n=1 Tax=Lepeophtheirus salmonis TaxID=72036 RepID=A0A0K2UWW2_LEPSM